MKKEVEKIYHDERKDSVNAPFSQRSEQLITVQSKWADNQFHNFYFNLIYSLI